MTLYKYYGVNNDILHNPNILTLYNNLYACGKCICS